MFQNNAVSGLFFLMGIVWGCYASGNYAVALGAVVGVIISTVVGCMMSRTEEDCDQGLWGFNGVLVGCAFPTFLGDSWQMWVALVLCAALTVIVRRGFNKVLAPWSVNSFTFPFVFTTWIFLLAARMFSSLPPVGEALPEFPSGVVCHFSDSPLALTEYWLKGISQVFLIDNGITGIFFLIGLVVSSRWAALWAAVASALSLVVACVMHGSGDGIAEGMYGYSAVLTGIALGCTFYRPSWIVAGYTLLAIITTVFVQAAMNTLFTPVGLASLTAPFCITTWLFLLPLYRLNDIEANHSKW
jgi:urea transporter